MQIMKKKKQRKNISNIYIFVENKGENGKMSELLEIKTASKMRQNTKSLIVTNNQNEKYNTNYASITVMPGPSSALFSHTQATSTTRSSFHFPLCFPSISH